MKISELLVESQQLDEGPILNKIGSAVGKGVGAVAKGVGAVAGGVAGLGTAVKKGFQAGKATVGGADDDADPAADKRNILQKVRDTMPGSKSTAATAATDDNADQTTQTPPATTTKAPAQKKPTSAFGKLSAAAGGQPVDDASAGNSSQYAQVKANIDKLDKKGKQRILGLLQKEIGAAPDPKPAAGKSAAGKPGASPAAGGTGFGYDGNTGLPFNSQAERDAGLAKQKADKAAATSAPAAKPTADPGAGAMGNMVGQLAKGGTAEPNTMANAPVSKTNTAKPGNPNAASAEPVAAPAAEPVTTPKRTGGKVAGQVSQTPGAIRKREATARKGKQKPAAPSQAEIDADRNRIMGVTSDSVIRTRPMMTEGFSLFRKR